MLTFVWQKADWCMDFLAFNRRGNITTKSALNAPKIQVVWLLSTAKQLLLLLLR